MRTLTSGIIAAVMAFAGMEAVVAGAARAATPVEYVALGDSYASGVGAAPYDAASGACLRSPKSYPRRYAASHAQYTLKDATCSGATIADVRAKQLSTLTAATSLITITVGGNDAQFTGVVKACLTESDQYCATATQWMSYYARNQLVTELAGLYTDIKARSPRALIFVLGYPQPVAMTGSCGDLDLTAAKRTSMNGMADALAEGGKAAATSASVYFIDMRKPFSGHGACGTSPWINGVKLAQLTETFHANAAGYEQGYAAKLSATWG
jgi:lysophospholipase L1-like esterase